MRGSPPAIETIGAPHSSTAATACSTGMRCFSTDAGCWILPQPAHLRLQANSGSSSMISGYFSTLLIFCFIRYVPSFTVRWSGMAMSCCLRIPALAPRRPVCQLGHAICLEHTACMSHDVCMPAKPQPRRAEHASDTRAALVAAARRLFAAHGYDGTGTEQIVADARVTRGALYHHFRDKADLFRAVMAEAAGSIAQRLIDEQLALEAPSPLAEIQEGISAFLDVCVGGDFQRIVLVDGPRVLGSDAWEELVERYGRGILEEWLNRCVEAGDLAAVPVPALARLLIAMLTEASLAIARSATPSETRAEFGIVLDRMLTGLRP